MSHLLIRLIKLYQFTRPLRRPVCRFYPTCSQYAIDAIQAYGAYSGIWQALLRLLRCHPFHPGGYDPVCPPESCQSEI